MTPETLESIRALVDETDIEGYAKLRLCADILAFVPGPFRDNAPGLLRCYETALGLIGEHVKYYLLGGEGRFKKVKAGVLAALPDWAEGRVAERNVYGLDLESGDAPDEQSDRAFQMYFAGEGTGFVRIVLPAETLLEPERFLAVAREALAGLRFASAYAGFAVNVRRSYNASLAGSKVGMISRRFRGIDLGRPLMFADYLDDSIKSVNWLTGVGAPLLARMPNLLERLPPSAQVVPLEHGVLIRASAVPSVGDTNRREELDEYAAVGRALAPLRIPIQRLGVYDGIAGTENTRAWLARFDGDE